MNFSLSVTDFFVISHVSSNQISFLIEDNLIGNIEITYSNFETQSLEFENLTIFTSTRIFFIIL